MPATLAQVSPLALEILDEIRSQLMVALQYMDRALWCMPLEELMIPSAFATDGKKLFYNPARVVLGYRTSSNELMRCYLHTILHCVFRHPFDRRHEDYRLWDLASDIAAGAAALELIGGRYPCPDDRRRQSLLDELARTCRQITAPKLYREMSKGRSGARREEKVTVSDSAMHELSQAFGYGYHGVWKRQDDPQAFLRWNKSLARHAGDDPDNKLKGEVEPTEEDAKDRQTPALNMPGAAAPSQGGDTVEGELDSGDRLTGFDDPQDFENLLASLDDIDFSDNLDEIDWFDISKQIEEGIEGEAGKPGKSTGTFLVNLSVTNRKHYDYRDFLRRFARLSEEVKVSTDEFDYIYYTYGLDHYENMPLIEPLEYQETNRIRDFVIAIDTSSSCAGHFVKEFVDKTYDILQNTEGFGHKVNIHLVQCDCDIRKDVKITSVSDLDRMFEDIQVRGFGGTDFRPVFKYVNDLIERREITNLKGLIYFTDGMATYPTEKPDYETVFVFADEDAIKDRVVPPWAMKVVMDEDDIREI